MNTALNLGASGGTAVTGVLLDALPLPLCYALAGAPALLAPALLPRFAATATRFALTGHDRAL